MIIQGTGAVVAFLIELAAAIASLQARQEHDSRSSLGVAGAALVRWLDQGEVYVRWGFFDGRLIAG